MRSGPRRPGGRGSGTVRSAASRRSRLTTVTPSDRTGFRNAALAYAPSATTHSALPQWPSHRAAQRSRSTANSSLVRNGGRWPGSIPPRSFCRTYSRASSGRATTPQAGWAASSPRTTQTCPYTKGLPAGPGAGLWWTPAPWTYGPERSVGVSSRASVSRPAAPTSGLTAAQAKRPAIRSARFPAAETGVEQGRNSPLSPAARSQRVRVRRPRAKAGPRRSRTKRAADRQSRAGARRKNHWCGAGVDCENGMAGSVRGGGRLATPSSRSGRPVSTQRPVGGSKKEATAVTWEEVKRRFPVGRRVHGVVTAHHPFGIFVDLRDPVALGLVQVTDFLDKGRMTADQYPRIGASIEAVVLGHTDAHREQIWLGLKPSQLRTTV